MTELLLGIDVGTTSCKAAVVTPDGIEVAHGARPTSWTDVPTGAEIDPVALAETAVGAALDALAGAPSGGVEGIGVTSMGETSVALDGGGAPLGPGVAWHDVRGGPEADRLSADLGPDRFARRTGLPLGPSWTIAKVAALRSTVPALVSARRWLSVAEWIVRWLGGEEVAERSLASRTGLLDVAMLAWWEEALDWTGLDAEVLPPLIEAGTPVGRVTTIPELRGAVLTVAGHDQPCGAVGSGATGPGDTLDSCGTAEAILRGMAWPVPEQTIEAATGRGLTLGRHVLPDQAALLGFFEAGLWLRRFLRLLGVDELGEARAELDLEALTAPTDGGPIVDDDLDEAAVLRALSEGVPRGRLWRAAVEATARKSARIVASADAVAGSTERLIVTGGWARSDAYRAIKTDVQGPFDAPAVIAASARGAAMFGGLAAGAYSSVDEFPPPPKGSSPDGSRRVEP